MFQNIPVFLRLRKPPLSKYHNRGGKSTRTKVFEETLQLRKPHT